LWGGPRPEQREHIKVREAVLFFFIVVAGTGGELCVSRAMKSVGEVHDFSPWSLVNFVWQSMRLKWMWAGIALMSLGFFSLLAILSFQEVSFVVPVSALSYAAGAFGAKAFLGERVSRNRWIGIAVVCVGVTIVWWSRK
jgi:drug/metabolite transporter (DMT)-like permease